MVTDFDKFVEKEQIEWRKNNIATKKMGFQNKKQKWWILPKNLWTEGLWEGIRISLPKYLERANIQRHKDCHNLKSSWMLCANLYFPFRRDKDLLAGFLRKYVNERIEIVDKIELEYDAGGCLNPSALLGEPKGKRGANQTSPDIAFIVNGGSGLILTENKYTEHSFYPCSGRRLNNGNHDVKRCIDVAKILSDPKGICRWYDGKGTNRKYWDFIKLSGKAGQKLKKCPAATSGYQLFRQQALAEGIAQSGKYDFVISCVAYDACNRTLIKCLRTTGIDDFRTEWGCFFKGKAVFESFSHQQFVDYVRKNDTSGNWKDWLCYINKRYGY
ncbi:MAG: hypothetical protein JW804_05335 [Sedimentisphaerales bacterium]|nr:hypothetical protein [Sedimentisphaerales bacterium]